MTGCWCSGSPRQLIGISDQFRFDSFRTMAPWNLRWLPSTPSPSDRCDMMVIVQSDIMFDVTWIPAAIDWPRPPVALRLVCVCVGVFHLIGTSTGAHLCVCVRRP